MAITCTKQVPENKPQKQSGCGWFFVGFRATFVDRFAPLLDLLWRRSIGDVILCSPCGKRRVLVAQCGCRNGHARKLSKALPENTTSRAAIAGKNRERLPSVSIN
eukprot:5428667-Amphidinium_carterae.2